MHKTLELTYRRSFSVLAS